MTARRFPAFLMLLLLLTAMQGQGAMTANQVAEKLGKGSRALNASLGAMCKDGLVLRHVDGKKITWSLAGEPTIQPEQQEPAAAEAKAAPAQESKTLEEIIGDIPAFVTRPDDLIIPSSRYISTEIRSRKRSCRNCSDFRAPFASCIATKTCFRL